MTEDTAVSTEIEEEEEESPGDDDDRDDELYSVVSNRGPSSSSRVRPCISSLYALGPRLESRGE